VKRIHVFRKALTVTCLVMIATAAVFSAPADAATGWNFTVPAQEIRPQNGVFVLPVQTFADGKARHYLYKHSDGEWIRFFVVKSADGVVRTAFDACDVCFRAKKGYVQQGNEMICINCGQKFRTDKIMDAKGGCNPGPLTRTIKDGNVILTQQDVLSGLRYFK